MTILDLIRLVPAVLLLVVVVVVVVADDPLKRMLSGADTITPTQTTTSGTTKTSKLSAPLGTTRNNNPMRKTSGKTCCLDKKVILA
jgi:hypothetical protein